MWEAGAVPRPAHPLRRATVRFATRAAPALVLLAAWVWEPAALKWVVAGLALTAAATDHLRALRHSLGRTLHDLAAGTVVLQRPRPRLFQRDES